MRTQLTPIQSDSALRFIEPMYAEAVHELPDGGAWIYEAKLDGYRCLAMKRNSHAVLWSRRGTLFSLPFPAIAHACDALPADTLIDGEVVAIDQDGSASFNALQHSSRPDVHLQYYAFDVLIHRGRDVMGLPLEKRRDLLTDALRKAEYPVIKCTPFDAKPADLLRAAKELGLEGVVAKRKGSIYESGKRSGAWQKYKLNQSQEFVIGGYTAGNPFNALIVGVYDGSALKFVAKVRAGFVSHSRREVFKRFDRLKIEKCPFANLPEKRRTMWALTAAEMASCTWLKPVLVAQIEFQEWTPDGHLRHSSFRGMRNDKDGRKVRRE